MTRSLPCIVWTPGASLVRFGLSALWVGAVVTVTGWLAPNTLTGIVTAFAIALVVLLVTLVPVILRWRAPDVLTVTADRVRVARWDWPKDAVRAKVIVHEEGDYVELSTPDGLVLVRPHTGPLTPLRQLLEETRIPVTR